MYSYIRICGTYVRTIAPARKLVVREEEGAHNSTYDITCKYTQRTYTHM